MDAVTLKIAATTIAGEPAEGRVRLSYDGGPIVDGQDRPGRAARTLLTLHKDFQSPDEVPRGSNVLDKAPARGVN